MKKLLVCISLLFLLILVSLGFAQTTSGKEGLRQTESKSQPAQADTVMRKLIGTWKLEVADRRSESGEVTYPLGRDVIGYLMYDSTGHMGVHLMRAGRQRPEARDVIAGGYTAYFGTYEVNAKDGVVIHHMEGNTDPNLVGQDYIRYYELEGDKLVLTVANQVGGKLAPKSPNSLRLVWRRVK